MKAEIEHYAQQDSPIHRWDARWKLASLFALILTAAIVNHPLVAFYALLVSVALLALTRLPLSLIMRRLGVVHFFLIPCFIILPFTASGDRIDIIGFSASWQGAVLALTLYLRAVAIVLISIVLLYSTSMSLLLRAAERLRVPRVLVQVGLLTYRYIFTLANELTNMRRALISRGFRSRLNGATYRTLANMVGITLIRSFERTDRIYRAMQCRGYRGSMHTLHRFAVQGADVGKSAVCLTAAVLLLLIDRL
ncbi:MAG: cobalt ECF transporter T component CbiQ [Candidatus Omnitrophica bacterium]|nr:cobalt ECF transporter T component CbiQ [Candidatus Omnitrophota bacterium]